MKIKTFLPVWLGGFLLIYGFNDIATAGWAMFAPIIYLFIIDVCKSTKALNWVVRQLLDSATGHEQIEITEDEHTKVREHPCWHSHD